MITGDFCVSVNVDNLLLNSAKIVGNNVGKVAFPSKYYQVCIENNVLATGVVAGNVVNWVAFDVE